MAISQMKKLSLVFPKEILEQLLVSLQKMQGVEIRQLHEIDGWQLALETQTVQAVSVQSEDSQEMLAYQKELEQVIAQLEKYLPQASLLKRLKVPKKALSFDELEGFGQEGQGHHTLSQVREKLNQLKILDEHIQTCQDKIDNLRKWKALDIVPNQLKHFSHIKAVIGSIPSSNQDDMIKALKANPDLVFENVYSSETEYGMIVFAPAQIEDLTERLLSDYDFKLLHYTRDDLPKDYLKELASEQEAYLVSRQDLLKELQNSQDSLEQLHKQLDYHLNHQARQESKYHLASTEHLTALEGWIETDQVVTLKKQLEKAFNQTVFLKLEDVTEQDWEDVPVRLKNNAFVEPFELVTEMYSLPKYKEKDPTPFLAPFYFTFFGMMVADLGYGLVLFLATLLILKNLYLDKGIKRFMTFFNLLGISVSIWGLIYGSFFGYNLPFYLLSTTNDVLAILGLSVVFGFMTLIFGLILGGLQHLKMKSYAQAYHSGFAWVMILSGIALLVIGQMVSDLAFLSGLGSALAIINALGILVVSVIESKGLGGLGSGLFNLYNISSYAGDLVSFTRLMALGLSGASIGSAFNLIVDIFPVWAKWSIGIVVFILLHAVNLFLSLLSGYVHGARLMFVEFFGKFYEGGGRAFQPLKPAEKYITITKEVHLEDK